MKPKIYKVGGAVRDRLLGLSPKEIDWVVMGATPDYMTAKGFKQVGKDFPVFLHPKTHEEYALARTERKAGKGYYGFDCFFSPEVTLEEDLLRRDLTMNAIAETEDGELIDPYVGKKDLENKVFRHVSAAFKEDPLRILRLARFAARFFPLGFTIAEETLALMREMVEGGELDALTPERVWREIDKALVEQDPSHFFLVLRQCGGLAQIWPDLDRLWGIPQPLQHHPEGDVGVHTMMVLQQAAQLSQDPMVRFAALCHDLGKGRTPPAKWPHHYGHEEEAIPCIQAFCDRYRLPNRYRDLALVTARFHSNCHHLFELSAKTLLDRLESLNAFRQKDRLEQFLLACTADSRGRLGKETDPYPQADFLRRALAAVEKIPMQSLLEKGLSGSKIKEGLRKMRLSILERLISREKK